MGKVVYGVAMSLDGFIAGAGGDMAWMGPFAGEDNPTAGELMERSGALLVGGRTWRGDDPNRGTESEGAFGGRWRGPQVVLTRRAPAETVEGVRFVGDPGRAVAAAREAAGEKDVTVLGAETARLCLEAGALDEVVTVILPVLLGDGVRLFEHPGGTAVRLERISLTSTASATNLWFRVL
jgi:dihydrofolate reductase